jgi:hypothetical protein
MEASRLADPTSIHNPHRNRCKHSHRSNHLRSIRGRMSGDARTSRRGIRVSPRTNRRGKTHDMSHSTSRRPLNTHSNLTHMHRNTRKKQRVQLQRVLLRG